MFNTIYDSLVSSLETLRISQINLRAKLKLQQSMEDSLIDALKKLKLSNEVEPEPEQESTEFKLDDSSECTTSKLDRALDAPRESKDETYEVDRSEDYVPYTGTKEDLDKELDDYHLTNASKE